MTTTVRRNWLDWLPLVGMIITIAGLIWAGSQYAAKVNDNSRRITSLESKQDGVQQLDVRLARIEATLEVMNQRARDR